MNTFKSFISNNPQLSELISLFLKKNNIEFSNIEFIVDLEKLLEVVWITKHNEELDKQIKIYEDYNSTLKNIL